MLPIKSLRVSVINKHNQITINKKHPNIMLDDSLKIIRQKIFAFHPNFIPNLTKFEVYDKNNDKYNVITDNNELLYNNLDSLKNAKLYVTILLDEIDNFNYDYSNMIDDNALLENKLKELQLYGYNNLTEDDLLIIIKIKLYNDSSNGSYFDDVQNYMNRMQTLNKSVSFYEDEEKNEIFEKYYTESNKFDFTEDIKDVCFDDISIVIKGNNVESGVKGVFIKLNEIFNVLELTETIPLIALGKKSSSIKMNYPQIKVLNISDNISDKDIRNWVLNEKKKINQSSYKIIKGLLIKSLLTEIPFENSKIFTSINILPNGLITVGCKFKKPNNNIQLKDLVQIILNNTNSIIKYINTFHGIFLYSKRINLIEESSITIESIDCSITTNSFIDRRKFQDLINKQIIADNIIELKDTMSVDTLSAYYKKIRFHDKEDEIKGITINIRDNPYVEDSSIINIFSANNYNQLLIILTNILIIDDMASVINKKGLFDDLIKKRRIQKKTNKKLLKEQGINFSSRECQAIKQPKLNIDKQKPIKNSYLLDFQGNNYRCDNPVYPYPGFTKTNIQCCFKIDQRGNEEFIRNTDPESLNIWVEPSNFKITIKKNNKVYETLLIKIVSEYKSGFDEKNGMPRYYFLSPFDNHTLRELIPITNSKLIDKIDNENNVFLDRVPLSQIIYPTSSKTKCPFNPDINNRTTDINSPCAEHKNNIYFGYTQKAIPCCFDKDQKIHTNTKLKKSDLTGYIFQTDKILNNNRLGVLPTDLNQLFNIVFGKKIEGIYYRMGIVQNNYSFLNVLLLAMSGKIKNTIVNNYSEFKQIIVNYLQEYPTEFLRLNNGDISSKYSLESYIKSLDVKFNWYETIELLEKVIKCNILIIEISDTSSSKLLCRPKQINKKYLDRPFIILIKKNNTFELIVEYLADTNVIIKDINPKIIDFFLDYYKDSCINKNIYPANFNYTPLLYAKDIISVLSNENYLGNIRYQIKNEFNKINLLMTKKGMLIPIIETGIIDNSTIKISSLSNLIKQTNSLLTLKEYIRSNNEFNKILKATNIRDKSKEIKILGITASNVDNIGGIFLNYGYIIPYRIEKQQPSIKMLDIKYYIDVDEKLSSDKSLLFQNDYTKYSDMENSIKNNILNIKKQIGNYIDNHPNVKNKIENIIIQTNIDKFSKINYIFKEFNKFNLNFSTDLHQDKINIILKHIANEICNDNKENLILNNIVTNYDFNKNDVKLRDSESILLNIDDIYNWIKKYKIILD